MMTWNHENNLLNANADVVFHVGANFYSCILYRMNGELRDLGAEAIGEFGVLHF